jgi:2-polyprenyl-6-methoxyphenol hydroxylase-like FAD-dependent oxidoreductase
VAVVGGGVGGLTAALSMRQRGHSVRLFEKTPKLAEVGAAISLWPNALAALDRLGLEGAVLSQGQWEDEGAIRSPSGAEILKVENTNLIIMHTALQQVLLAATKGIPIVLGARCVGVTALHSHPTLQFEDGSSFEADLVIGADGIRTAVRQALVPDEAPPSYSGLCAWRGVLKAPGLVRNAWLSVGEGLQFMAAPLPDGDVYWSPLVRLPEGHWEGIDDHRRYLRALFRSWHEPIPTLLELTPNEAYLPTPVYYRSPPTWLHHGKVIRLVQCVHPSLPTCGWVYPVSTESAEIHPCCRAVYYKSPSMQPVCTCVSCTPEGFRCARYRPRSAADLGRHDH